VFRHELPFNRSSLTRWRQRLGEEQMAALLQESLSVAHRSGAIETKDSNGSWWTTTVQEKAIAHPTDARLSHRAIEKLVDLAQNARVSRTAPSYLPPLAKAGAVRCCHAKGAARPTRMTATRSVPSSPTSKSSQVSRWRRIHGDKGYRGHNYPRSVQGLDQRPGPPGHPKSSAAKCDRRAAVAAA